VGDVIDVKELVTTMVFLKRKTSTVILELSGTKAKFSRVHFYVIVVMFCFRCVASIPASIGAMGLSKQECKEPEGHFSLSIGRTIIMSKKKEIDRHGELGTRCPRLKGIHRIVYPIGSILSLI
jgi:hypothetical protein